MKIQQQTIELMGAPAKIFGVENDPYFSNLPAYAAQNNQFIDELRKLKRNATVIDVGANIGITAVIAARYITSGRIIAIEPSPSAFECLEKTVTDNNLNNVTTINVAAGEIPGEIGFVQSEFLAGSHVSLDAREQNTSIVKVLRLDEILINKKVDDVNLVKIDVEGFELDVLLGAQNTIKRLIPDS